MSGLFELRELRDILEKPARGALKGDPPTKEEMQTALQALFVHQCLYAWTRGVGRSYQLIIAYESYFERVLDALGRGLLVDPRYQMVAMTVDSNESRYDRRYSRLKLDETMVLLALRLAYEEGIAERNVEDDGGVEITSDDLLDKLLTVAPEMSLNLTRLDQILALFRRKGFVSLGELDRGERLRLIRVLPGIDVATPANYLEEIISWQPAAESKIGEEEKEVPDPPGGMVHDSEDSAREEISEADQSERDPDVPA